jgi:phenylalanyl-tRNA synthetase beta chain
MGGAHSEISNDTTEIILEAANWHPATVRKASQRNGLRTEAVQRFEKSLDAEMTLIALRRAIALIQKLCPKAELVGGIVDHYVTKIPTRQIEVSPEKIQRKIGDPILLKEMKEILKKLEFRIIASTSKKITIEVPSFRATKDISTEDDIVEEIARMHGYEKITPVLPALPIKLPKQNRQRKLEHATRSIFSNMLHFSETYNYSFYSQDTLRKAKLPEEFHLKIKNPLSEEQTHLRISLVPNILHALHRNLRFKKSLQIYEIGHTYAEEHEYFPREELWVVGAVVTEKNSTRNAFLDIKGAVDVYMQALGIPGDDWEKSSSSHTAAHPHIHMMHRAASGQELVHAYALHPIIAKNFDLQDHNIAMFEINLSQLESQKLTERTYVPIPRHPGIEFDVAILIDKKTPAETIKKKIENADLELIKDVSLFDHYEGPNIASSKKSLAYRILLQSDNRTLTDEDMARAQKTIGENITAIGGTVR